MSSTTDRKPKYIQINTVCNNSTGKIMHDIQIKASEAGFDTLSIVGRRKVYDDVPCVRYGNFFSFWFHVGLTTLLDRHGFGSRYHTKKMVERLRTENPDIIHLHNIHGYVIHIPTLFDYLNNEFKGRLIWTFHDCWPMTGHCAHFVAAGCDKYQTGCFGCPNKKIYPVSLFADGSKKNYADKKELFAKRKDTIITTPSKWMASCIEKSFFKDNDIRVISNGIDIDRFTPGDRSEARRTVCEKYGIDKDDVILLGVSNVWNKPKGLNDLIELSKKAGKGYRVITVGLNDVQIKNLPGNMVGIRRTESVDELITLYRAADIFINPSLEESFSLVTIEAQSCGTPVIVLDTSAVAELVNDENGIVLHDHSPEDYLNAIKELLNRTLNPDKIHGTAIKFDKKNMTDEYLELLNEQMQILNNNGML